jgi:hypothetical protein
MLVHWAFILENNGQQTTSFQIPIWQALFVSFRPKDLANGGEFVQDKSKNLNSLQVDKLFFPKHIQTLQFEYFNSPLKD